LAELKEHHDENKKLEIEGLLAKDEEQYILFNELAENHIKELLSKQKIILMPFFSKGPNI